MIDETLTLLKVRGEATRALRLGEAFFRGTLATVYYLNEADVRSAWETFRHFTDKGWSFTDCASKVVMEKLNVTDAFAFDRHFHQFGNIIVIP